MKKLVIILGLLVACSVAINLFLLRRVAVLHNAIRINQMSLTRAGQSSGRMQAERDFTAGNPLWYQVGDFSGGVPREKAGRKAATVGCVVSEYEIAFVESYNKRMDELYAHRSDSNGH